MRDRDPAVSPEVEVAKMKINNIFPLYKNTIVQIFGAKEPSV